jgi:hypothetical protein
VEDPTPDEDEAALRRDLPPDYPPQAVELGRPRFRVERQVLPDGAFKPVFAAALTCIPAFICLVAGPILPRLIAILWALGMIAFSVWFIGWQRRKTRVYAVVYPTGFVHFDGLAFHIWRWADVASVNVQRIDQRSYVYFIQVDRLLTTRYDLRHRDGTRYGFWSTQGPRAAQFGAIVEFETFRLMMPAAQAHLQAGQTVDFSPFRMDPAGLVFRDQRTAWADLGRMIIEAGALQIEGAGPNGSTTKVLLGKIDNSHVFLPLLEEKQGRRARR